MPANALPVNGLFPVKRIFAGIVPFGCKKGRQLRKLPARWLYWALCFLSRRHYCPTGRCSSMSSM